MRILFTKSSDQRHALELVRADGTRDRVELVTREALFHDFLHFSVESALPTQRGFWGTLASGKTIADLNDRTGESTKENAETLYFVEGVVGVTTNVVSMSVDEALARLNWFRETQGQEPADWCTREFVASVLERMRQLIGQWKATPYGQTMEIEWTDPDTG